MISRLNLIVVVDGVLCREVKLDHKFLLILPKLKLKKNTVKRESHPRAVAMKPNVLHERGAPG